MRAAFVGKGGSGKTTLAAALIEHLRAKETAQILACDADINQCLFQCMPDIAADADKIPRLSNQIDLVKQYILGSNNRIKSPAEIIKTSPPASGSKLIRLSNLPHELRELFYTQHRLACLQVGSFQSQDLGSSCYHAKTGSLELLLNHIVDTSEEIIICDMTAGADTFASGLVAQFDVLLLVVEPTKQSTSVYRQFAEYASNFDLKIECIANKVHSNSDLEFIEKQIQRRPFAIVPTSAALRSFEQGEAQAFYDFVSQNQSVLCEIYGIIAGQKRDWRRYYERVCFFHQKNCLDWANAYHGADLQDQIDPNFNYIDY